VLGDRVGGSKVAGLEEVVAGFDEVSAVSSAVLGPDLDPPPPVVGSSQVGLRDFGGAGVVVGKSLRYIEVPGVGHRDTRLFERSRVGVVTTHSARSPI
jgi:hypothetical protein